jgi:cytochrome b
MSGSDRVPRYPTAVIVMHWAIAAAVVGLVALGWWMQAIPKQPVGFRADADNLHKSLGLAALLLMAVRLAWRASHRPPELPPLPAWQARAARFDSPPSPASAGRPHAPEQAVAQDPLMIGRRGDMSPDDGHQ